MKKIGIALTLILLLTGCAQTKETPKKSLMIGVMPSLDSVPILWADAQGMFEEAGLDVTLLVYTNGNDRDTQVQTGTVDAVVTDIMGLVAMREAGYAVKGVSETQTRFSVVSQKDAMTKDTLKVGMAEVSVTQYMADSGLRNYTIEKEFIDALPQRLEMVSQNLLDGGIIPEPMASLATLKGLEATAIEVQSPNVLMFQESSLLEKADEIKTFYEVYNKAVDNLDSNQDALKEVVAKALGLDESIIPVMTFPTYTHATTVDETVYNNVVEWMKATLNMNTNVPYSEAVSTGIVE